VVGGLVQDQEVQGLEEHTQQGEAALLAPGEYRKAFVYVVAPKKKGPQHIPEPGNKVSRGFGFQVFKNASAPCDGFRGILRKVPRYNAGAVFDISLKR